MNVFKIENFINLKRVLTLEQYFSRLALFKNNKYDIKQIHKFLTLAFSKYHTLKKISNKKIEITNLYLTSIPNFFSEKCGLILVIKNAYGIFVISEYDLKKLYPSLIEETEYEDFERENVVELMFDLYDIADEIINSCLSKNNDQIQINLKEYTKLN